MDTLEFSGINHQSQSSIGSRPTGTEAADHLAMDDRRSQSPFGAIIGWADIRSVQEDEHGILVTMFEKAALQAGSLGILARRALQQSITKLLQAARRPEVFRRHFLALICRLMADRNSLHGSWPERVGYRSMAACKERNGTPGTVGVAGREPSIGWRTIANPTSAWCLPITSRMTSELRLKRITCRTAVKLQNTHSHQF